ncbi:hypothetical protein IKP13_08870 [bacterium]|nr:hypothetical protein [bacterium]
MFSAVRIRVKAPKTEMRSICGVQITFFEKAKKRRKTKKTSENRWFSGADLFRPHTMRRAAGSDRVEVKTGNFDVLPVLMQRGIQKPILWRFLFCL